MLLHCVSERQTDRIVSACLSKRPGRIRARPARGRCACFLAKVGIPELLCTEKQRGQSGNGPTNGRRHDRGQLSESPPRP